MAALRIAILTDAANKLAAWEEKLIAQLADDDRLELVAILECGPARKNAGRMFQQLMAFESHLFLKGGASKRANSVAHKFAVVNLQPNADQTVSDLRLDVILNHAGRDVEEKLAAAARWGVWALDFNAGPNDRRSLAGFWAVKRQDPTTTTALLASRAGPPQIIARGAYNTKLNASSNAAFVKEKSVALVMRELRKLASEGALGDFPEAAPGQPDLPGLFDLAAYGGGVMVRLARRVRMILQEKAGVRPGMWHLKTGRGDFRQIDGVLNFDPATGVDIIADGNRYWADPFLITRDGAEYVFFEDYDYRSGMGCIAVGKIDGDKFTFLGEALRAHYHLSFPYLFEDAGVLYMMPETAGSARIEIWRCDRFPFEWTLHATALEGASPADSAIIKHEGVWWLFTNLCTDCFDDHCSDLYLFQIDGPSLGEIKPHRNNPVIIDSATARGGGRIFAAGGKLFRPSQINTHGVYGYGLNIAEIEALSLHEYREQIIRRIEPDFERGIIGCHHFDHCGDRWVIDVRRKTGARPR